MAHDYSDVDNGNAGGSSGANADEADGGHGNPSADAGRADDAHDGGADVLGSGDVSVGAETVKAPFFWPKRFVKSILTAIIITAVIVAVGAVAVHSIANRTQR